MPNIFELSYNVCEIISFTLSSPFWLDSVKFSGHTISKDGISVDCSKVQEVMDWKPRKSVHQIRSFLGLAGYYVDSFRTSPGSLNLCVVGKAVSFAHEQ
jgi:hypothetical protein